MNIHKHMEVVFVATLAVIGVGVGSYIVDSLPEAQAKPSLPAARDIATPDSMAVVIVHAPRAGAQARAR
jgi:hypothetical protein